MSNDGSNLEKNTFREQKDVYQFKCDFVVFEDGTVLLILYILTISNFDRMQLYQFILSSLHNIALDFVPLVPKVTSTIFSSPENFIFIRDSHLWQKSIIHKASRRHCTFRLFTSKKETSQTGDFRVEKFELMESNCMMISCSTARPISDL